MPTIPIVSSENIEGNIGQCQTTKEIINCYERVGLFSCNDIGYMTNSCTGKVDIYKTWSPSGISWMGIVIFGSILLIVVFNLITKLF